MAAIGDPAALWASVFYTAASGLFVGPCFQQRNRHRVVAIGEFGLDYDRLHFCGAEEQRRAFLAQLALVREFQLPMFLHMREACEDFVAVLRLGFFPALLHCLERLRYFFS